MATWEILTEGDTFDTPDGEKQYLTIAVSFTCPQYPDDPHRYEQEVMFFTDPTARQAQGDTYAADYEAEYCANPPPPDEDASDSNA